MACKALDDLGRTCLANFIWRLRPGSLGSGLSSCSSQMLVRVFPPLMGILPAQTHFPPLTLTQTTAQLSSSGKPSLAFQSAQARSKLSYCPVFYLIIEKKIMQNVKITGCSKIFSLN